ncbi:MAG TPA: nucleotide exchange factor GrpE [Clostridiales bacterium]|nr:nucleotide exchange factor GrpE [Clostridiales bacterium]
MGKDTENKTPIQEQEIPEQQEAGTPVQQEVETAPEQEPCAEQEAAPEAQEATPAPNSELELLQEKYNELQDQYLRLLAEYDNYRKRTQREKDEIFQAATAAALQKILPIQDNFERASAFACHTEEFAKGYAMIQKSFSDVLTSFGVEAFGEVGEPFNPELHHAVMHIEDETLGENVIAQVLQKGYRMGNRILRYAMVQTAN